MPYKVADVSSVEVVGLTLGSLLGGALVGIWLSKPSPRSRISLLFPVGTFLLVSGVLGGMFNFGANIEGFPALALFASMAGLGMFSFWFAWGIRYAS